MKNGQVGLSHQGGSQGMRECGFARRSEIGWMKDVPKDRNVEPVGKRHKRSAFEATVYYGSIPTCTGKGPWYPMDSGRATVLPVYLGGLYSRCEG